MPSMDRQTFDAEIDKIIEKQEVSFDPLQNRENIIEDVIAGKKDLSEIKDRVFHLDETTKLSINRLYSDA